MAKRFSDSEMMQMLIREIESFFLISDKEKGLLYCYLPQCLERIETSFSYNTNKYYHKDGGVTYFDALHSCQWFMFVYTLANTIWHAKEDIIIRRSICDKLYGLSKILSSCDLYYEVDMPEVWSCDHPMGSVIGRAKYGNNFSFSQGCTVGNNHGIYPVIEDHVSMLSNAKVLGKSHIGSYVILAANSYVKDTDIPDHSIVFGQSPNLVIKENRN